MGTPGRTLPTRPTSIKNYGRLTTAATAKPAVRQPPYRRRATCETWRRRKGLTYRSYGEYGTRASTGTTMDASPGVGGLLGHVSTKFELPGMRDTDNAAEFLHEFEEFERNVESPDPGKRLPNFRVMSRPEDHNRRHTLGRFNPIAMVPNNDYAAGMIVDRITHSRIGRKPPFSSLRTMRRTAPITSTRAGRQVI